MLQIWDAVITSIFVGHGIVSEANWLIADSVYSGNFLWHKLLGLLLLLPLIRVLFKYYPRLAFTIPASLTVFYLAVLLWNFMVIFSSIS